MSFVVFAVQGKHKSAVFYTRERKRSKEQNEKLCNSGRRVTTVVRKGMSGEMQ